MKKKHKIFMVGTTHFDPVWMWTWDEGMASIRSTFRSALDRMKENPGFIYSFSCPAVFEWIREVDPPMFAEIKQRVQEGRWDLVEGWWLQPDCTLLSGESYVRQGLYGQRYLLEHFGKISKSGFNTDSFGHSAMLPQIYKKSGMDSYVFGRPTPTEKNLPGPMFMWESPDGSQILAFRCGSDGANSYPLNVKESIDELGAAICTIGHDMLMLYGVSNHGGAPTKKAITEISAMIDDTDKKFDIGFSSVAGFCEQQDRKSLPVVRDELLVKAFGVFCNHTEVKKNNRRCEYTLLNAERFALVASMLTDRKYPSAALTQCWKDTLFNQFHDIIGGASVRNSYFDARNMHGRALQTANEIVHYSLQAITRTIDTSKPGFPLLVWNPNTFDLDTAVEAELQWAWEFPWYNGPLKLSDHTGKAIPCQIIHETSGLPRFRSRFVFRAKVPSVGYKVYYVQQESQAEELSQPMNATPTSIENRRYRISIDQTAGCIALVYDKKLNRNVMTEMARPVVRNDKGDTWAFNIKEYGEVMGEFKVESITLIENGPVRAVVRIKSRYNNSQLEQDIILYQDSDEIEGKFKIHWCEKRQAIKLCFTPEMQAPTVTSAIPYGAIERPNNGEEVPAGEWLDMSEDGLGAAIITDSVFSYDVKGATAGFTLLRSCIFAHHGHPGQRSHIDESKDWEIQEQGVREGAWKLILHDGDWRKAQIPKHASAFNNPVITIDEANHDGNRPAEDSLIKVEASSSLLAVAKKAEDDDGIVIRMYEYAGAEDKVKINITPLKKEICVPVGKYEIKTLKLNDGRTVETDMLEM
jgi:alpha-mannosidase